ATDQLFAQPLANSQRPAERCRWIVVRNNLQNPHGLSQAATIAEVRMKRERRRTPPFQYDSTLLSRPLRDIVNIECVANDRDWWSSAQPFRAFTKRFPSDGRSGCNHVRTHSVESRFLPCQEIFVIHRHIFDRKVFWMKGTKITDSQRSSLCILIHPGFELLQ